MPSGRTCGHDAVVLYHDYVPRSGRLPTSVERRQPRAGTRNRRPQLRQKRRSTPSCPARGIRRAQESAMPRLREVVPSLCHGLRSPRPAPEALSGGYNNNESWGRYPRDGASEMRSCMLQLPSRADASTAPGRDAIRRRSPESPENERIERAPTAKHPLGVLRQRAAYERVWASGAVAQGEGNVWIVLPALAHQRHETRRARSEHLRASRARTSRQGKVPTVLQARLET